ncbi:hypothetical protein A0H81_09393 [Grifola frondosa]|uniref:Uncharacterized protein n=1 Tax=Grifola frondosa TaxID=5627 RepID=A0A1C7M134_GRIFR|nr:hypothetical protein A0H81_09393 [Grifola frondosa]
MQCPCAIMWESKVCGEVKLKMTFKTGKDQWSAALLFELRLQGQKAVVASPSEQCQPERAQSQVDSTIPH